MYLVAGGLLPDDMCHAKCQQTESWSDVHIEEASRSMMEERSTTKALPNKHDAADMLRCSGSVVTATMLLCLNRREYV